MDEVKKIILGDIEVIKVYCGEHLVYLKEDENDESN